MHLLFKCFLLFVVKTGPHRSRCFVLFFDFPVPCMVLTPRSVSPVAPIVLHLHSIVIELLVESLPLSIKINLPLKCLNLCC